MAETLLDRFLRYVQVDTQSDARSGHCPSTPGQLVLQKVLRQELVELGVRDVRLTDEGYVIASFPTNRKGTKAPRLAFFAHVDTAPDFSGKNVKPIVHRKYDGRPIRFPANPKLVLDQSVATDLAAAYGKDIVTGSGDTLLGADDKAGVAILMTLAEWLVKHPEMPHGEIRLCFTPDEEIGRGVDKLDLKALSADIGYTLDGGPVGEICWETFSGDSAEVLIQGVSTHPGEARAKGMVNAACLAAKLLTSLPRERCAPETTHLREGFIHPLRVEAGTERATVRFILRDFEMKGLEEKRAILKGLCAGLAAAEPHARVECRIRKQYRNMAYWLRKDLRPVELARQAVRACGLNPVESPIRGGTDGSRLTEEGLPTPNLFAGMHNIHSPLEWVAVQDMEKAVEVCRKLIELAGTVQSLRPKKRAGARLKAGLKRKT
jgi:tripeptide aminopeptidase